MKKLLLFILKYIIMRGQAFTSGPRTIKKTIGGVGVAGCDFNFATAANQNEQVIDLGEIIPTLGNFVDVFTRTDAVFTGAVTLVAETGTTSSGDELIASTTIYATDAITPTGGGGMVSSTAVVAAQHVYVSATPGADWTNVTAGKVSIYITYVDTTNL